MAFNTVSLSPPRHTKEIKANAAITPGMLCERMSTGNARAHSLAGNRVMNMFALEDESQGRPITTAYTADNQAQFGFFGPGDEVYALLASGETVAIDDFLESNGDGYLRKAEGESGSWSSIVTGSIVGIAMAAATGGSAGTTRVRVEIK